MTALQRAHADPTNPLRLPLGEGVTKRVSLKCLGTYVVAPCSVDILLWQGTSCTSGDLSFS